MNILYASCLCSKSKYKMLFEGSANKPGQQVQKYHRLIVEGLAQNNIDIVETITALPITRTNCRKKYIHEKNEIDETYQNLKYNYLPIVNIPLLKNLLVMLESFFSTLVKCIRNKDSVLICDVLNISVSAGAVFAAKLARKKKKLEL